MANKLVAVFLMCIVVVAAMQLGGAEAGDDLFSQCFHTCHDECMSNGNGSTFCEMKCDVDCVAKEDAEKMNLHS